MTRRTLIGHLFAIVVIIFWGMTFVSSKVLLKDFTPIEILFDRFVIATLALLIFAPKALKFISFKVELYSAFVGLYGVVLYFLCENNALVYSNASNVCLIVSTTPLFVGLINCILVKKFDLSVNFFLGFVIAITGIACLSMGTLSLHLNPLGDLLALGSAIMWAGYNYYVIKLKHENIDTLIITIKSFFYSVILTIPCMLYYGYDLKLEALVKTINIVNYVFLAVLASSFGFYLWNKAIDILGVVKTNVYIYGTPVVTVVGAIVLIDETITIYTILGMILAIAGLVISQLKSKPKT